MNERERSVCDRVKEFREKIEWSQSDFAQQIGATRDQVAGIENGRTPLRYNIAWKLRVLFGVSLAWLADGEVMPDTLEFDDLPTPELTGLPKSALLTEVADKFHGSKKITAYARKPPGNVAVDADQIQRRVWLLMSLRTEIEIWIARVPDVHMDEFFDKLIEFVNTYLNALPADASPLINARHDAMLWAKMRADIAERFVGMENPAEMGLTEAATSPKLGEVKPALPKLLERLQRATADTGKMSELANWLGVPLASVSRWLSGKRAPGGEITLRLLHWVEQQERQK